ncbi:hypothetical protein CA85_33340 [Allorhodopirellula solitaria]|uniref:Uncharacterized protein n=1 Tax=Allorhodopirellula solitaria TaxID=2527987 RepID=A0A5C5XQS9_9BACT|nr:hypothetical protein CA85_33340 [Allorhodopirellula solitaria]
MLLRKLIIATSILVSPSLSHALTTEEVVTPENIRKAGNGLAVTVTKHTDGALTFCVSMTCIEGELALLRSHISDGSATYAHSTCFVSPLKGRATAQVTIPEKFLPTSSLSFSFVRSRRTNESERILMSGANVYYISLVDFSSQVATITPPPEKPTITTHPAPVVVLRDPKTDE